MDMAALDSNTKAMSVSLAHTFWELLAIEWDSSEVVDLLVDQAKELVVWVGIPLFSLLSNFSSMISMTQGALSHLSLMQLPLPVGPSSHMSSQPVGTESSKFETKVLSHLSSIFSGTKLSGFWGFTEGFFSTDDTKATPSKAASMQEPSTSEAGQEILPCEMIKDDSADQPLPKWTCSDSTASESCDQSQTKSLIPLEKTVVFQLSSNIPFHEMVIPSFP